VNQPLKNIKVLEQGTFITGPCAGMMLADLGADVIKVESRDGDPYRAYQEGQFSPHFQAYNRNKRSIALDLKGEDDKAVFDQLVGEADVYIQNFRPGAAERMGAGKDRLMSINPRLVYCAISGFGGEGPYLKRPSYDSVAQALSGFLSVVTDPSQPRFLGPALADAITGIYAAYGILGALVERGGTGKGRLVEVSMLEAMMHFTVEPFTALFALGKSPTSSDRPKLAQAHILKTADDKLVVIHLSSLEKFWQELTQALSAEHLRDDPRFSSRLARIDNYDALAMELNAITQKRNRSEWIAIMDRHDVPFAAASSPEEAVQDPQVAQLQMVVPIAKDGPDAADRAIRPAVTLDGQRQTFVRPAPRLDADSGDIRARLLRDGQWPGLGGVEAPLKSRIG
jgi:crotonobetainyl-CoA:carnitine CoA-transferase CaiB-like acyl-CoA transferase